MKPVTILLGVAIAAALVAPTWAAERPAAGSSNRGGKKYELKYKFAMGEVLRYRVTHRTHLRTTIDATTQEVETDSDSIKAWKVTDVLPSGEMEFVHVVESVRMTNQQPGQPEHKYDSVADKSPPPGFEQAARSVGVPLVVVRLAPNGEVTHREEKVPQPKVDDTPITLELPKQPVAVGERWTHAYDVQAAKRNGAKIAVATRRVCRLRQVKNGVATIEVKYQVLTPIDPFVRSTLVGRLTDGVVRFDLKRGRILEQEHNVDERVLGFRGEDKPSSMHLIARIQERLLDAPPRVEGRATGDVQTASAAESSDASAKQK